MGQRYFPGLNALRFLAALFVVISHIHNVQIKNALPGFSNYDWLYRGHDAVVFFFTLSGFLITYLLMEEQAQSQEINLRNFYIRRILRIWPLYFLIILVGFILYWGVLPALGIHYPANYNFWTGFILFALFFSNVMSVLFQVGGILNITWSISVEEQFYLFWAPFIKLFNKRLLFALSAFTLIMLLINIINQANFFHYSAKLRDIIKTLLFHNMAIGALAANFVFHNEKQLLSLPIFSSRLFQLLVLVLLVCYYFYSLGSAAYFIEFLLPFIYAWLIVNVSINKNSVIKLENNILDWLGKRSYGIYMYHMIVIYALLFLVKNTEITFSTFLSQPAIFYLLVIIGTVLLAHFSYHLFEKRFLSLKVRFR